MADVIHFKCPGCGGPLEFDPKSGEIVCTYCGNRYSEEEIRRLSEEKQAEADKARAEESREKSGSGAEGENSGAASGAFKSYHCQNCGAEIVTEATTAATRCYYCHSPVVLSDRLSDEYHPDGVIPFKLDRDKALELFKKYVSKKWFIDRAFFAEAALDDFTGVYYPYWIGDFKGDAVYDGEGKIVTTHRSGNDIVTVTQYYRLHREGRLTFRSMIRKALGKTDRQLSDGIHPYEQTDMQPFASGYLSGFLAEKRDVEEEDAKSDMIEETRGYVTGLMTQDTGLTGLHGKASYTPRESRMRYVLLPTWLLTWTGGRKGVYYYMMNGQTGRVCGKLPLRRSKLLLWSLALMALVAGLMCLGGVYIW